MLPGNWNQVRGCEVMGWQRQASESKTGTDPFWVASISSKLHECLFVTSMVTNTMCKRQSTCNTQMHIFGQELPKPKLCRLCTVHHNDTTTTPHKRLAGKDGPCVHMYIHMHNKTFSCWAHSLAPYQSLMGMDPRPRSYAEGPRHQYQIRDLPVILQCHNMTAFPI